MATISLADGQAIAIPSISFVDMSGLVFENAVKTFPGVTKGTGNPPAWIEFDASISPNGGVRVKQANVVAVWS